MNQNLVEQKKEGLRKLGIASYQINDMTEQASLESEVRKDYSLLYAAVRDPYSKAKGHTFRIFNLDPQKPQIPMGYTGMPYVCFECFEEPRDFFIKKWREAMEKKYPGTKYAAKKMYDDQVNFKKVVA